MNYNTYQPHPDLSSIIQCYWTLEIPASVDVEKQRIIPDGSVEMAFILGDNIRRYITEDEYIIQPRAMVLGQTVKPFYILPEGEVETLAVRFYPYGFANLIKTDIKELHNKETALHELFGKEVSRKLEASVRDATDTKSRIEIIETFLLEQLSRTDTIDKIVSSTVEDIIQSKGSFSIDELSVRRQASRRQLERKFSKQVGLGPRQLGKVIRLQAALKLLIHNSEDTLTQIAYKSDYYDQAHFIKDFQEFTGTNPKNFLKNKKIELSTLFYSQD